MSARQSACGQPASFLHRPNEFFAFWATGRAENAKGRKIASPCPAVQPLARALRLLSSRAVSSRQARSFYHPKKGADTFGNIFF